MGEQPYDLSEPPLSREGWWVLVSGSLSEGRNKDGREEWKDFDLSGSRRGPTVESVVNEFLNALRLEGW